MTEDLNSQRIDKWLWHARFTKSRSLAQKLVSGGGVRVDRERVNSPSRLVKPGNVLTLSLPRKVMVVEISDLSKRRGPYSEASLLYKDMTPVLESKVDSTEERANQSEVKEARPDKRKRRQAIRLKQNYPYD
ncbi:MAG: RNA-binding S4 domain-containing protein [Pseudomonadota bacterium]